MSGSGVGGWGTGCGMSAGLLIYKSGKTESMCLPEHNIFKLNFVIFVAFYITKTFSIVLLGSECVFF